MSVLTHIQSQNSIMVPPALLERHLPQLRPLAHPRLLPWPSSPPHALQLHSETLVVYSSAEFWLDFGQTGCHAIELPPNPCGSLLTVFTTDDYTTMACPPLLSLPLWLPALPHITDQDSTDCFISEQYPKPLTSSGRVRGGENENRCSPAES